VLFHSAAGSGGEAVVAPPFPGVRNLGLGGPMPGDGNATAACLRIGRQEKGDRDSVVVHHLGEHGGTVLPAPAVGIRTSRWFDEGGQAERLGGTESGEQKNPRPAAQAVGVQLGVRGATRYIRTRLSPDIDRPEQHRCGTTS
jgi:hypothetical protein